MRGYSYDIHRAIQALGYLQQKTQITDKLALIKLLFFADRYHLRTFGISMLEDKYIALRKGPVCSYTLDLINKKNYYRTLPAEERAYVDEKLSCNNRTVRIKNVSKKDLSKSALQAIDFSINNFSSFDPVDLVEIAHAYPEWKKFEEYLLENPTKSKSMDYADFFLNPSPDDKAIKQFLDGHDPFKTDEKFLEAEKEEFFKVK